MLVSEAISELLEIDALDLEDDEAFRLLNEANVELCVRSRWTRATFAIGPTVAGQAAYGFSGHRITEPLAVYVDAVPYTNTDRNDVALINIGDRRQRARGNWFIDFASDGTETINLLPIPSTAGQTIEVLAVYAPTDLATTDRFTPPGDFHRACVEYVQGVSLGGSEDDVDRKAIHMAEFERQVARLHARRITRSTGHRAAQMRVVTA